MDEDDDDLEEVKRPYGQEAEDVLPQAHSTSRNFTTGGKLDKSDPSNNHVMVTDWTAKLKDEVSGSKLVPSVDDTHHRSSGRMQCLTTLETQ